MRATLLAFWGLSFALLAMLTAFRVAPPLLVVLITSVWVVPLIGWSAHWLRAQGEDVRSTLLYGAIVLLALLVLAAGLVRAEILRPAAIVIWWLTILSAILPLAIALLALTSIAVAPEAPDDGASDV